MSEGVTEMQTSTMIKSENIGWKADEPTEVVKKVFKEALIKPGDKVLDIGCGFGRNANWLAKMGTEVTAININEDEIKQAEAKAREAQVNVNYIHADATSLPFSESLFDVALDLGCSHMVPTKEGQEKVVKETARILKQGGHLIYFGFSKDHPSYRNNTNNPMFRSIEDVQNMYGGEFDILSHQETQWKPRLEEHANFKEHVGINVVMRKK